MSDTSASVSTMQNSESKSERWTAVTSTLVAVAILAAGVTASQQRSTNKPVDEVQQWESDLRFQIGSVFRHDARARDKRLAKVNAVMESWQHSQQTLTDRDALVDWLTEATVRSMPGAVSPLPPAPEFDAAQPLAVEDVPVHAVVPQPATPSAAELTVPNLVERQTPQPSLQAGPVTPTPAAEVSDAIELQQPAKVDRPKLYAQGPEPTLAPPLDAAPPIPVPAQKNDVPHTAEKPVAQDAEVHVNLTELAARIAGYHDALDDLEMTLLRSETPTVELLAEQLDRLEKMTSDYQFVTLYYATLNDREKKAVLEPRSVESTLAELTRQLDALEKHTSEDFLDMFQATDDAELAKLREKLAQLQSSLQTP